MKESFKNRVTSKRTILSRHKMRIRNMKEAFQGAEQNSTKSRKKIENPQQIKISRNFEKERFVFLANLVKCISIFQTWVHAGRERKALWRWKFCNFPIKKISDKLYDSAKFPLLINYTKNPIEFYSISYKLGFNDIML